MMHQIRKKIWIVTFLGIFIFSQILFSGKVEAAALIDKQTFFADQFAEDLQKYMELVREKEEDYDNPITRADLNEIEDYYDHIFYLIDLELVRVKDQTLKTQERLEIESVLLEIDLQFQETLNNIENKLDSDVDDDFDDFSKNMLDQAVSYKGSIEEIVKIKTEGSGISKGTAIEKVSVTTEDLAKTIEKLEVIINNYKNLSSQMSGVTPSLSNFNTYSNKAYGYIEDAENEIRKLSYVNIKDSADLRSAVSNIQKESDDFLDDFEAIFEVAFERDTTDLKKIIEYGQKQLTTGYQDVISNRNITELSITEVLEELETLERRAQDSYEDIPDFEIGNIVESLEDLLDDDEDEDTDDLLKTAEELRSKASVSSYYRDDVPKDLERRVDNILEGFKRVRKGTYSTTIGAVLSSMDTHISSITTIKNGLDTNISLVEDLEDTEEDLENVLDQARNSILELRLVGLSGGDQTDLDTKIDSLGTALSTTLDTLDERISSGLDSYYSELLFDLKGSTTTSAYSMMTRLYNTVDEVATSSGDGVTTAENVLTYISSKQNSLSGIENGWGRTITSETVYRDSEKELFDLLDDIQFQMYRLVGVSFEKSVNSKTTANNYGHYLRNMLNEAEDYIDRLEGVISSEDNDDLEELIQDLYETIDDGISLLEDAMTSSLSDEYTDILDDIEDEKDRLELTINALNISGSSSSSSSGTQLISALTTLLSNNESDINDVKGLIPDVLDSYSEFETIEDDIFQAMSDTERSLSDAYNKRFTLNNRITLQTEFDSVVDAFLSFMDELENNSATRVISRKRDLMRNLSKDLVELKIIMDQLEIYEDTDEKEYKQSTNLSSIANQVARIIISPTTMDEIADYHKDLANFKKQMRTLDSYLKELIENKPTLTTDQKTQLEKDFKTYQDNYKRTADDIEDAIMDEDDTDYLKESFKVLAERYNMIVSAGFTSALDGYKDVPVVFTELYERKVTDEEAEPEETETEVNIIEPAGVDTKFTDVKKDNAFSGYIQRLQEKEIIAGYSDGNFYPEKNVSRAEFVKMAMLGTQVPTTRFKAELVTFNDVSKEDALAPYIGYAVSKGYINGYNNETFGPGDQITRLDAIRILIRIKSLVSFTSPEKSAYFSDISSPELATLTDRAYEGKLISGFKDGTFGPYKAITRGETAKIIARAFLEF